jgi:hypothetical protein
VKYVVKVLMLSPCIETSRICISRSKYKIADGACVELIGSPRIGGLNSSMSGDLVSKVGQARAQDGDADITRELGRTLEVRTCTDRGLYAGHKDSGTAAARA